MFRWRLIVKSGSLPAVVLIFGFFSFLEASQESGLVEMKVRRVMLDPSIKTPTAVVLLESLKEKKLIPIWIGNEEATSIAVELENVTVPRPNTHDLIRNILQGIGAAMHRIIITDLRNNVYYATITLRLKGQDYQIDSRPSDAIAVALRMRAPIFASSQVLAKAGQVPFSERAKEDSLKIFGLQVQDLTPALASLLDLQVKQGVLVADVELGSAGFDAGIQRGDIILKTNDRPINKVADLESFLKTLKKPSQARLEVLRKGKPTTVVLDLPS
jgi:hypothetical protein